MKVAALVVAICVSVASAGVVITPVFQDQIVAKSGGDCFYGEVTPQGCAYVPPVEKRGVRSADIVYRPIRKSS